MLVGGEYVEGFVITVVGVEGTGDKACDTNLIAFDKKHLLKGDSLLQGCVWSSS